VGIAERNNRFTPYTVATGVPSVSYYDHQENVRSGKPFGAICSMHEECRPPTGGGVTLELGVCEKAGVYCALLAHEKLVKRVTRAARGTLGLAKRTPR
jgi:hypothetical protein